MEREDKGFIPQENEGTNEPGKDNGSSDSEPAPTAKGINRREFLTVLAAAGMSLTAEKEAEARETSQGQKYYTGWLAGKKLHDLYAAYTGLSGIIPPEAVINFPQQLEQMWAKKFVRAKHNSTVENTGKKILKKYAEHEPKTESVGRYHVAVERALKDTMDHMDWDKLGHIKNLDPEQLKLVKSICLSVNSRHLLAYCLTELMPSADGKLNVEVLNFLLQSAGPEYIESIPAMFDPKTSFGPYQFTEYALYENGKERRGASIPNQALTKGKIPGSVAQLQGMDHHKAAYLFMVDNFSNLVHKLNSHEFQVLKTKWHQKQNDLVAYAATAHHGPAVAMSTAKRWLDSGANHPYMNSCGRIYALYAKKTEANFAALKNVR